MQSLARREKLLARARLEQDCCYRDDPVFFFKQKTAYDIGLGIPAEPLFRSFWEGVNPDGYFLDKLEPIPSALPSFQKLFQVSATALSIPWKISTTPEAASVTTLEISFAVAPI